MTELAPVATMLLHEQHHGARRRSCGRASPNTLVRIVDTDDHELPRGTVGEVAVAGGQVMLGYWNNPGATREALCNGWMHTGDAGYMDDDGFVYIIDRIKDMIISGGENIYPAEVERALASHPAVANCAVIGVSDPHWGERVHAVIVATPGMRVELADVRDHVGHLIARYKAPRSIEDRRRAAAHTLGKSSQTPTAGAGSVIGYGLPMTFTDTDSVDVSVIDSVATVTLNRPGVHNAWDDALGAGLKRAFTALYDSADVRCIILTGEGPTFCSGADLATGFPKLPNGNDDLRATLRRRFHPGFLALMDAAKPVIAAINGPAIGTGACLALASDIAVMSRAAFIQFRFSAIGLMPDVGATALLTSAVGAARATEIFMLAERIGAQECRDLGLVSRVADDVVAEARELAVRLAAGPTRSYATTKDAVRRWSRRAFADQLELEAQLQQTLVATEDWAEGRAAFLERRDAAFVGR